MWLSCQLEKSTAAYNRCSAFDVSGRIDYPALQQALSAIVERHEILRTEIISENDSPLLHALPPETIPVPVIDISHLQPPAQENEVRRMLDAEAARSFDLDKGPWLRAGILRKSEESNTLYITTHHIASDGWSDAVMFGELQSLYAAFAEGKTSPLAPVAIQYRDFAAWQHEEGNARNRMRHAPYWEQQLAAAPALQEIATDHPRPEIASLAGARVTKVVESTLVRAIETIGRAEGATPAMTSLAAFAVLQSRIADGADTIVGLSLGGRTHRDLETLIGFFTVTMPLRVNVDRQKTFRELLGEVRKAVIEANQHQDVPLDSLLELLPSAQKGRNADIGQTLFNFRNMPAFPLSLAGLVVRARPKVTGGAITDLELEVTERAEEWQCDLTYRSDLYETATADRLLGHYVTLLQSIAATPDEKVGLLPVLTHDEREQILAFATSSVRDRPDDLRIHELIRAQAAKTPDALAVVSEDRQLAYGELDRMSDALAADLLSRKVKAGDFVGICIERSPEMVVALLAIMKSGAAFVPLDPDYPAARLAHMLSDSQPVLTLADGNGQSLLGDKWPLLSIDSHYLRSLSTDRALEEVADRDNAVACVLYTSGSTGLPKGVLSTHRGICNNLLAMQETYSLREGECVLQHTSIGFDTAAFEYLWPLIAGAYMYLARPGGQRDPEYLVDMIRENRIATLGFAPSVLRVVLEIPRFAECTDITRVICYGEVLSVALREKFFARLPQAELHNLYGPTEASIIVTHWKCQRASRRRSVPIGRPLTNAEIYILDGEGEIVPIGVPGELFIGGPYVAGGYHNRPELTAERFPRHPFRPDSGERVYRSGDIARFSADGVIEYIGRRDNQLKIRGVRVELEEIEAALDRLKGVRESAVVARADSGGDAKLIAYVALSDHSRSTAELRRALESELPPQFIPALIIPLDGIPHGPHGKIDRAALPDHAAFVEPPSANGEIPVTAVEQQLAKVWKEMLELGEVGRNTSFFSIGGHSLLAVRMVHRVEEEFRARVSLRDFYRDPTIAGMATLLSGEVQPSSQAHQSRLLKVRGKTNLPTIFYFNGQPPGAGRYVHKLSPYLPTDQGFYIGPLPILNSPTSVESIAAQMLSLIRTEDPTGPYILAGNCFGATLALEIAQQLDAEGEHVPLVVLVHPDALAETQPWYRVMRRLALMSGVPEHFHHAHFSSAVDHTLQTIREIVRTQRRLASSERIDRVMKAGKWMKRFVARPERAPLPDVEFDYDQSPDSELITHRRYLEEAWVRYKLRPYFGRVGIVWPEGGPSNPPWDPQALWKHLTPNFVWRDVPGHHWSMLIEYFDHTAAAIAELIQKEIKTPTPGE
jgi:amino acid adenylation domain-containing protein